MAATFFLVWHGSGPSHLAEAYFVPGVNPHSYKETEMWVPGSVRMIVIAVVVVVAAAAAAALALSFVVFASTRTRTHKRTRTPLYHTYTPATLSDTHVISTLTHSLSILSLLCSS